MPTIGQITLVSKSEEGIQVKKQFVHQDCGTLTFQSYQYSSKNLWKQFQAFFQKMQYFHPGSLPFQVYVKFKATDVIMDRPNTTAGTYDLKLTVPDDSRPFAWILILQASLVSAPGMYIGLLPLSMLIFHNVN